MLGQKPVLMRTVPTRFMTVAALCAAGTLTLAACGSGSTSAESTAAQSPSTAASSTAGTDATTTAGVLSRCGTGCR